MNGKKLESYATPNALFYFSVAPEAATSPFSASAESEVCPQHAQQGASHIRHHLITGHERIANAGSARNIQVLLWLTVPIISPYTYLSPCLSQKLMIPLCCFVFLQCDPVVQQPIGYNLAVSSGVLKHVHVASRLQSLTLLGRMLGTCGMLLTLACLAGYQREVVGSG